MSPSPQFQGVLLGMMLFSATSPQPLDPWLQQAQLTASYTGLWDRFGGNVAISGDTVVVGADWEDSNAVGVNGNPTDDSAPDSGAAYTFVRAGSSWLQQAYLKASNTHRNDYFGHSVAISKDTVVVGAPYEGTGYYWGGLAFASGAAYVFVRQGLTWTQQAHLKASNLEGAHGFENGDHFGMSVAISGNTVVVGAPSEDGFDESVPESGAAYVFVRDGSTWSQQAYLKASNAHAFDGFFNVAISGDTVVVGAPGEDSNATGVNGDPTNDLAPDSGAAYVFVRSGSTWTQQAYLKASNTGSGFDAFGTSIAISGDTLVVGAPYEDSNATGVNGDEADNSAESSGAAYVFVRSGSTWSQQAYLKAPKNQSRGYFGGSVSISGDRVVVASETDPADSTVAYVFARHGTTWSLEGSPRANTLWGPASVSISGPTIAAGKSGAAYVFTTFEQLASEIPTLGSVGLAVLLLALAAVGLRRLRSFSRSLS